MVKKLDDFEGCLGEYLDTEENKETFGFRKLENDINSEISLATKFNCMLLNLRHLGFSYIHIA